MTATAAFANLAGGASASITGAGSSTGGTGAASIQALRSAAARDPKAAIKETARQFEALFMQQLMKSMRDATTTSASGMLDNEGTRLGTDLLDAQYATKIAGLPGGLADAIARQLERQMAGTEPGSSARRGMTVRDPRDPERARHPEGSEGSLSSTQIDFVTQHGSAAQAAQGASGIPAAFMVAQAAHETGWGRREIRNADGSASHNLFGIKATAGWTGPVAEVTTTEWIGGEPQKVRALFRAYASYAESFKDYARLITESPRYADVAARVQVPMSSASAADFATGLQRAGYATDPAYASKLTRTINTTLRLQRLALT